MSEIHKNTIKLWTNALEVDEFLHQTIPIILSHLFLSITWCVLNFAEFKCNPSILFVIAMAIYFNKFDKITRQSKSDIKRTSYYNV